VANWELRSGTISPLQFRISAACTHPEGLPPHSVYGGPSTGSGDISHTVGLPVVNLFTSPAQMTTSSRRLIRSRTREL